ncbi:hypothetical protein E2320_020826, partial [Naja naja]
SHAQNLTVLWLLSGSRSLLVVVVIIACLLACPDSSLDCCVVDFVTLPHLVAVVQAQLLLLLACLLSVPSVPAYSLRTSAPLPVRSAAASCSPVSACLVPPAAFNDAIGKARDPRGLGERAGWMDGHCPECNSGREERERKPQSPEAAPLECRERLQFNPLYPLKVPSTLLPRPSVPLLRVQEEPHSHGDWLALRPRGKARGSSWGKVGETGGGSPFPASQGFVAKEAPPAGTLMTAIIQSLVSFSWSPSVTGVSSGAVWGGLQKALPSSPLSSSPGNSVCSQRTERRKKEMEKGRERGGEREKEMKEREKERKREKVPSTLLPRPSVPLLRVQEEPHSHGDWLALRPEGKSRGSSWEKLGRQEEGPLPSQPGCPEREKERDGERRERGGEREKEMKEREKEKEGE